MDVQKLAYDLALVYTQVQYAQKLADKTSQNKSDHPQYLDDSSFMAKTFTEMYIEFLSTPGLFEDLEEWGLKPLDTDE